MSSNLIEAARQNAAQLRALAEMAADPHSQRLTVAEADKWEQLALDAWAAKVAACAKANAYRDHIWETNQSVAASMRIHNPKCAEDAADLDDLAPKADATLAMYGIDAPALPIHASLDAVHAARKRLRLPIECPEAV